MAKLHVPSPEGADDRSDVNLAMLAAFLLIGLAGILMFRQGPYEPHREETPKEVVRDVYDDLADQRELSNRLAQLDLAGMEAREWTEEDRRAALRFGPRVASEFVCEKLTDDIKGDRLGKEMRLEFEKALDRRAETAPWTCMTRLFLADAIPNGSLNDEMAQFWGQLEEHDGNERLPISVLEAFREARERPENPKFWSWLRICALDFDYSPHADCQKLLYQMAPAQGADLLDVIEHQWREVGTRKEDMPTIIAGIGYLARNGQPHNFKVKETPALPDYDVDFRQAAVGYLCRMMNAPTAKERGGVVAPLDEVPQLAGEQLRKIGLVGARAYEHKLLMRWREACRLAFGGSGGMQADEEYVPVPLLAVWGGDADKPADLSISEPIARDACEKKEGYPDWFCLADKWVDEENPLDRAVAHVFIKTRYMEWDERFDETTPGENAPTEEAPMAPPSPTKQARPEPPKPKPTKAEPAKPEPAKAAPAKAEPESPKVAPKPEDAPQGTNGAP